MAKPVLRVTKTRTDGLTSSPAPIVRRKRSSSPLPILLILVILVVAGYFSKKMLRQHRLEEVAAEQAQEAERQHLLKRQAEEDEKWKNQQEAKKKREQERRVAREAEIKAARERERRLAEMMDDDGMDEDSRKKKKTEEEWLREELALREKALKEIAEAERKAEGTTVSSFAGVRFGEPIDKISPVCWGPILDEGDDVASRGVTCAIATKPLSSPVFTLSGAPRVWVTPTTHRPYRIEMSRPLKFADTRFPHEPATTNLARALKQLYPGRLITVSPWIRRRPGCSFVIVSGSTTMRIAETGRDLVLSIEREDLKREAKREYDAWHQARLTADNDSSQETKRLDGQGYPLGDNASFNGVKLAKFKEGTPRSFCGLRFGRQPKPLTPLVTSSQGEKFFYLDYRRAKCPVFCGFAHGKADVDPYRGGVWAVRLFSEGDETGLDDVEYATHVRNILTARYGTGSADGTKLTFEAGDARIVFGPRAQGGFLLECENVVLAKVASQKPPEPKEKYSRRKR